MDNAKFTEIFWCAANKNQKPKSYPHFPLPHFTTVPSGPTYEERRGVYGVLVWKLEGKTPLGRPRFKWKDNIKLDLQEVRCGRMDWINLTQDRGCGGMDWINLAQDRDRWLAPVNGVMNFRVPYNAGNFLTG